MRLEDREALHEYRAGWRYWFYEAARLCPESQVFLTLTLADGEVAGKRFSDHTAEYLRDAVKRRVPAGVDGLFIFEFSRRGTKRVHCHALLVAGHQAAIMDRWRSQNMGWTDVRPVTDLMGAVYYITKSFGPETIWLATGRWASWLTEVSGLTVGTAQDVAAIGATAATARGTLHPSVTQKRMLTDVQSGRPGEVEDGNA